MDNLYEQIYSMKNLILAYKKARKGKTRKHYVIEFEENLAYNLKIIHDELRNQTYCPRPLVSFPLRDPKTRIISKAEFRDRIVHHALVNIIEPIFDTAFIIDSCANRKGKGTLFAIKRFELFKRKITNNLKYKAFCLKADIKHYFQEINNKILINSIKRKVKDKKVIFLIRKILASKEKNTRIIPQIIIEKGMPLGNLTSQFFANVYLHELDYFVKHKLKCKYYIRYVDDFVVLHSCQLQLKTWKICINDFLKLNLGLRIHPDKSRIISISRGIDFVGFRIFYYHKLLRKRNIRNINLKITSFNEGKIQYEKFVESFQGWQAYAKWSNSYCLSNNLIRKIII